ncbi:glycosyltransferase family 2 protein [Afipia birgiae]|jgi:hypothetical protein|uniref:glycosyltransferase family 2 protein n=1 Tax=Afipia birgiae TaxID=151414 RepID=UPI0002E15B24|nr:glycosyltransferase family 2 protein [Afipia birgiae]
MLPRNLILARERIIEQSLKSILINDRRPVKSIKVRAMACSIQVYCVANHQPTLTHNLQRSPEIADGDVQTSIIWGASAASAAYCSATSGADADILVFAHQDVYFPDGWFARLQTICQKLSSIDPSWAVAGLCGRTRDGQFVGHLWDSGVGAVCGGRFDPPRDAATLDEVVLIVRRASGIKFDPALPSFHLYGTDIVLEARKAGMNSYVIDLPIIHNSKADVRLDHTYLAAYRYMIRKWKAVLPWPTVIVELTNNPLPLLLRRMRMKYKSVLRQSTLHPPVKCPEMKANELGFLKESENAHVSAGGAFCDDSSKIPATPPSMTVVVCVESGLLEPLTVRMVDSLRRFGGRFANLEVVAVTPRMTPPLARETRRRMAELGIKHLQVSPNNPYSWHHYMNKAEAIAAVEDRVTTEAIAWVDSDILFTREPNGLELLPGVDFLASAPDAGVIGSRGVTDPNDPFWQRSAELIGKDADDLPWLQTGDGHRIRFYWNAGLYVYRRKARFGREFLADFKTFLDRRVARTHSQVHFMDQVVLGLTVVRLGLAWRALPDSSNFPVCSFLPENYDGAKVADVSVLHFHDSMNPELWDKLLSTLAPAHPLVHQWLAPQGPVVPHPSVISSLARESLRIARGLERRFYYAQSGFTKTRNPLPR